MKIQEIAAIVENDNEGVEVQIYQRDEAPYLAADGSPCTITVVGAESDRYKAAKRAQSRRLMKRARSGGRITPEESEAEAVTLCAAAVVAWHGWEDAAGKDLPCTPENVRLVLAYDHIFEQVQAGIMGHAAFFASKSDS